MSPPDSGAQLRACSVLYIIPSLAIGGTEGQLVELASRLDHQRFEPLVCALSMGGPLAHALRSRGVRVEEFRVRGERPWHIAIGVLRLAAFVLRLRPTIVHGMLFWGYVFGAFLGRIAGAQVIVASRRSLGFFKDDKPHYLLLERLADRLTDVIVANSEAVRADTVLRERVPQEKVVVIQNGVATPPAIDARALRMSLGLPIDAPVVGVIANLIAYKGHSVLLRAWRDVRTERPEAVLALVGEGPMRADLLRLAEELELGGSVRFLGSRADAAGLLPAFSLVCLPSLSEGSSNAVLEAMAAGKPVVATAVGGNVESITSGETGLLVRPNDPSELAGAILDLLADPRRAAELGSRAQHLARERYALEAMVRSYEDLYAVHLEHRR